MDIRLVVFDLDDTLLDTTSLLIPIANTPEFEKKIREPLPLMPGALENLQLFSRKFKLNLLTQGRTEAQKQKVESLSIAHFFSTMYFADPRKNQSKGEFFQQIWKSSGLPAEKIMSIGNRRSTDIREAKKWGMTTCLFHYGEHDNETAQVPEDNPDFTVQNHSQLRDLCLQICQA